MREDTYHLRDLFKPNRIVWVKKKWVDSGRTKEVDRSGFRLPIWLKGGTELLVHCLDKDEERVICTVLHADDGPQDFLFAIDMADLSLSWVKP